LVDADWLDTCGDAAYLLTRGVAEP